MQDRNKKIRVLLGGVISVITIGMNSVGVLAAPQQMPDGTVFDAEYYAQSNPDVVAALGSSAQMMWAHYITFGKNEGRQPVAGTAVSLEGFDAAYYAAKYTDVVAALGNDPALLRRHYDICGKSEGRYANAAQEQAALVAAAQTMQTQQSQAPSAYSMFQLINSVRTQNGVIGVTWSEGLEYPVSVRVREIQERFENTRPNGQDFRSVLEEGNVQTRESCELYSKAATADVAIEHWMENNVSRSFLLKSDYSKAAVACEVTSSGTYWEVILIQPK